MFKLLTKNKLLKPAKQKLDESHEAYQECIRVLSSVDYKWLKTSKMNALLSLAHLGLKSEFKAHRGEFRRFKDMISDMSEEEYKVWVQENTYCG